MTLDGYYEGPGGNPLVLNMDRAFDEYNLERIRHADIVLLGRRSVEMFSSYWPGVADAPHDADTQQFSETNRTFSRRYNELPKTVISDTYQIPTDNPWYDRTTVVSRGDIAAWLGAARSEGDGDILVFGSRSTWNCLHEQGHVDELHLMVGPDVVGAGTPVFGAPTRLELLDVQRFEGSPNAVLRYAASRS